MNTMTTRNLSSISDKAYRIFSFLTEWSLITLFVAVTFSTALCEIAIVTALVSWTGKKVIDRDFSFLKDPVYLVLTAFVTFIALSVANSEHFYISFRGMIKAVKGIVIFFILVDTFKTKEQVIRLVKILSVLFLVVLFNGLWQYETGKDLIRGKPAGFFAKDFQRRITSSFGFYSQLGTFLILLNSLFLGILFGKSKSSKKEKVLLALLITLGCAGLFFTGSRASWLAFGGAVLFLGIVRRSKLIIGGLIAGAIIAAIVLPSHMKFHFDYFGKEQSASERLMLWRRAADVIKAHPFLGCGINTYNLSHAKYDTVKDSRVKGYYAHNGYLQLAAEIGLFGIAFFILFLILFFLKIIRKARDIPDPAFSGISLGALAGCFGFLCLVMVDTVLQSFQTNTLFWMFMGLAMAAFNIGITSTAKSNIERGIFS